MHSDLAKRFGTRVHFDEPMSKHTTFRIGGPADALVDVEDADELSFILDYSRSRDLPLHVIGRGANLLVGDGGIRGIVVRLAGKYRAVDFDEETNVLRAGAGASLSAVCDEAVRRGFNNFCWTAGIPGTVGGAILGNAGAWGHDIGQFVESVSVVPRRGEWRVLTKDEVKFDYRHTTLPEPGLIVVAATLRLENVDAPIADPKALCRDYIESKRRTQPLDLPSAGSVFKNPKGQLAAAALIDKAGCKGMRVEGALVSPRHANFIVNAGGATATDVKTLIRTIQERVKEQFGVELELELQVIG